MIFLKPKDFGAMAIYVVIVMAVLLVIIYGAFFFKAIVMKETPSSMEPIEELKEPPMSNPEPSIEIAEAKPEDKPEKEEEVEPEVKEETKEEAKQGVEEKAELKSNKKPIINKEDVFYVQIDVPVLRVRSGPGAGFPLSRRFINEETLVECRFKKGMIVKVKIAKENENEIWYEVQQPDNLKHPERILGPWFIAGKYNDEQFASVIEEKEIVTIFPDTEPGDKWIEINRSTQTLKAFEKDKVVMESLVSSGKKGYETPVGTFWIWNKQLSAYMQGPQPGYDVYLDFPGIPFVMYFTPEGNTILGTYWHSDFGRPVSGGCVNLPIDKAEWLFWWTNPGTKVVIK